jgi:nucleotide-binding universal stress UspA family protein
MNSEPSGVVLVAIDGSQNSMLAAGVGARIANMLGARLRLIHVLDVPPLSFWVGVATRMKEDIRAQAEITLTHISDRIGAVCAVVPEYSIVEGIPEEEILRVVKEDHAILMVVAGRHGIATEKHSTLSLRRMGHLTEKLAMQLPVPVVVVPHDIPASHICPAVQEFGASAQQSTP